MKTILLHGKQTVSTTEKARASVMIESPFAGDINNNVLYARMAIVDGLYRFDEAPMAFHLLYTQSLCDASDKERKLGIDTSFRWHDNDIKKAFYVDRGFSQGMYLSFLHARENGIATSLRTMSDNKEVAQYLDELNNSAVGDKELSALRVFLDAVATGQDLRDSIAGDKTGYGKLTRSTVQRLETIERANQDASDIGADYERICVRESILSGRAPLSKGLMERQLGVSGDWLIHSWADRARRIEVCIDFGITPQLVEFIKQKDMEFFVKSLSNNKYVKHEVDSINRIVDRKDRLANAAWVFDRNLDGIEKIIQENADMKLITGLNKKDYQSKERELNL